MNEHLIDPQLTRAEIRLAQYGQRTSTWSTATYDNGAEKALHEIALGLKAEVDRLRAELVEAQQNYEAYRIGAEGAKRMLSDRLNAVTDLCDAAEKQAAAADGEETPA